MDPRPIVGADLGLRARTRLMLAGVVPHSPRLAIVGSRAAHREFADGVRELVAVAAALGWTMVSGGAFGIDGAVHEAALDLGAPQVAVLPCGPDMPYPPDHLGMFERIARSRGSGVLFARPPGTTPTRAMFASRNALVVRLASACVVVESARRSGTMITGKMCLRERVPLAVVAGSPGAAVLAARGAVALGSPAQAPTSLRDWLVALRGGTVFEPTAPRWPEDLAWLERLLRRGDTRGLAIDDLPDPGAGLVALARAEALGLVACVGPGRYLPVA